jgi:methanogenesis imperfect marker protein 11
LVDSISPLKEIICVLDQKAGLVQIYEEHSRGVCRGAAAWTAYHYSNTSELVLDSYMDGPRDVLLLKLGRGKLKLTPSFSSAGIEEVSLVEDGERVEVTYAGLGGAGVGITQCRQSAKGVLLAEILESGGGEKLGRCRFQFEAKLKLHVGIDDTDSKEQGATWSLGNELGYEMGQVEGINYINHTLVQLYPYAPGKTTNCVSTVLTFAVPPGKKEEFLERFAKRLKETTTSDHTGMVVYQGIDIPQELKDFTQAARTLIVELDEIYKYKDLVEIVPITGNRGLIGALGAIGMSEDHNNGVVPGVPMDSDTESY